ncbi:hypothetical protein KP509_33G005500 [Ceratopteris richardii]|uniref:EF-hand domain-containing protein n=1 Tax=Ceratopteris richardii TaxID=49495 RepID=A0A8T2QLE2_CERRI|nr:hypothetical protein KP509_33G005500 [Ceratopteris richardii]
MNSFLRRNTEHACSATERNSVMPRLTSSIVLFCLGLGFSPLVSLASSSTSHRPFLHDEAGLTRSWELSDPISELIISDMKSPLLSLGGADEVRAVELNSDAEAEEHNEISSDPPLSYKWEKIEPLTGHHLTGNQKEFLLSSPCCDATYGVMPCSDSIIGNLFLVGVYGILLFFAAKLVSDGSQLLLTVLDAGVIGGLVLPVLGALPDSILIMVSGLGGSKLEAQEQVLVGIGLLAGSNVMLLTLLWGSCLILGRTDLKIDEESGIPRAMDKQLSKAFGLSDTGVEIDHLTQLTARIMLLSIVPFVVAQLPRIFSFSTNGNIPVLVACILAFSGLLAYCLYQIFTPWLQQRRKEIAQRRVQKFLAIEKLMKHVGEERIVDDRGNLNKKQAVRLFKKIDRNHDGEVNFDELRTMLSLSMGDDERIEELIQRLMLDFDLNENQQISLEEFLKGMQKWCSELRIKEKPIAEYRQHAESYTKELQSLGDEDENGVESEKEPPSKRQIIQEAVLLLLGGTIIAGIFADPLVDSVDAFSKATGIPSFFISFVLLPLVSNCTEGISSIMSCARKRKRNISLAYSQVCCIPVCISLCS